MYVHRYICKMYTDAFILHKQYSIYRRRECICIYIPSKKSIEGSAGLRLELKITTTDFRSCHKVLV